MDTFIKGLHMRLGVCVCGNEVASETHWVHQKVQSPRPGKQERPDLSRFTPDLRLSPSKWDKRECG